MINDTPDLNGNGSGRLMKKLTQLLARATSSGYSTARLWMSFARLLKKEYDSDSSEEKCDKLDRVIDYVKRSNRAAIQKPTWSKDITTNVLVLNHCQKSLGFYLTDLSGQLVEAKKRKENAVFRLALNNIAITAESSINHWDTTRDDVKQAKSDLEQLKQLISQLN